VGGQNVHVAELSSAFARRGHRVSVYTRRDDPDLADTVETPQGYTDAVIAEQAPRQWNPAGMLTPGDLADHPRRAAFQDGLT
jgi:hypothetical protein